MSSEHPLRPVLLVGDEPQADALRGLLVRLDGWYAVPTMDLLAKMGRLLWGHEAGAGEAGVSALVDRPHLLAALRRLADALISSTTPHGTAHTVDVIADPNLLARYVRDVWPDALVVAFGPADPRRPVAGADPDVWVELDELATAPSTVVDRIVAAAADSIVPLPGLPVSPDHGFDASRSPLNERVIVVLGAARSGTTWLHRLLSANPKVAGTQTGESWLFPDVAPLWSDEVRAVAGDDLTLTALRAFCDDLLSGLLRRCGDPAAYVCEKTPTTVWRLPLLTRLYPDAHYVHIVRDGRDVAASLARTRGDDADVEEAAREWVEAVDAVRAATPSLRRLSEIRYEDLLDDPQTLIENVWTRIGVPVSAEAHEELVRRVGERVTPLPASGEIGTGKWRSLPEPDRQVIEKVTGPLLRELGYSVDAP